MKVTMQVLRKYLKFVSTHKYKHCITKISSLQLLYWDNNGIMLLNMSGVIMVQTRRGRGWGQPPSPPPQTPPSTPPRTTSSPEMGVILRSLETIMATLNRQSKRIIEVETTQVSWENSERAQGPRQEPLQDISRELQKIKIPEFLGGRPGKHAKVWLECMKRCFTLNEYTSSSKARMAIF